MNHKLTDCKRCGGHGQLRTEYIETTFGNKMVMGISCSTCGARTSFFMCENEEDEDVRLIVTDLWNRGRIAKSYES